MKIAIIDYETGNLKSVSKALELASNNVLKRSNIEVINSAKDLNNFDKVVLPGQGSFKQCFQSLNSICGILDGLRDFVTAKKKPILGICVGMQLFSSFGDEDGGSDGLGWIKGKVKKISLKDLSLKLPHMGWNNIQISSNSKLLKGINNDSHFYFVHSYSFNVDEKSMFQQQQTILLKLFLQLRKKIFLEHSFIQRKAKLMV